MTGRSAGDRGEADRRFAQTVAQATDVELGRLIAQQGETLVRELLERQVARYAGGPEATVGWEIAGVAPFVTDLRGASCELRPATAEDRLDVRFRFSPAGFLRLLTGDAPALRLALAGQLGIEGPLRLALAVAAALELPDGEPGRTVPPDPARVDTSQVAATVAAARDEALERLMLGPLRNEVLAEVFTRMVARFRPGVARDFEAVVQWKVLDRPGGGYDLFELEIRDGACVLSPTPSADPEVTFRVHPADFLRLVTGNAEPLRLVLARRLQVIGDVRKARRMQHMFSIPQPPP